MLINSGVRLHHQRAQDARWSSAAPRTSASQHLYQGREDKLVVLDELLSELNLSYEQVAYLGDDLPDLPVIRRVGLGMAVANAAGFVRQHAAGVTQASGGEGAAREFCELIMSAQGTSKQLTLPTYRGASMLAKFRTVPAVRRHRPAAGGGRLLEHQPGKLPGSAPACRGRQRHRLLCRERPQRSVPARWRPALPTDRRQGRAHQEPATSPC